MQLEAIYHQGHLKFLTPVNFRHSTIKVAVTVPDDEVISPSELQDSNLSDLAETSPFLSEVKDILGPWFKERATSCIEDDKEMLLQALKEKYVR